MAYPALLGRVTLAFRDAATFAHVSDPVAEDLSAAARADGALFLSCDETAGIERLTPEGAGRWGRHVHANLGAAFDLPAGPDGEMDIEGLEADDGWLWVVGSHSLKRKKPKRDERDAAAALRRMERVARDPNRYFLGRLPLAAGADGAAGPVAADGPRRAACLPFDAGGSTLERLLSADPHLAPFLAIPSKENGLDVEGIAAEGERVWLGLRGPVLRGHAVILELAVTDDGAGVLAPRPRAEEDGACRAPYVKHVIDTHGLGVRDLARDGEDLVILTGPTLGSDGPSHVHRWRGALSAPGGVVAAQDVPVVAELPYLGPLDHPEGIVRWPEAGEDAWLVVHDSPHPDRLDREGLSIAADIVRLPP